MRVGKKNNFKFSLSGLQELSYEARGIAENGWVFVSGFALHNVQFKAQMLMAKLAQIPCYR